jgi:hypothetical protein
MSITLSASGRQIQESVARQVVRLTKTHVRRIDAALNTPDFHINRRIIDPPSQFILWQIGALGDWTYRWSGYDLRSLPILLHKLLEDSPSTHEVVFYEAPLFRVALRRLPASRWHNSPPYLSPRHAHRIFPLRVPRTSITVSCLTYRPTADMTVPAEGRGPDGYLR